jgi:glucose/arabinose dehydrogenase
MKLGGILVCLVFAGCGAAPAAPATSVTNSSAASVATPASQASPQSAGADVSKEAAPQAKSEQVAADPAEPLPKIEFTPANELRQNTRAKLEGALKSIKGQTTAAGVTAVLTRSLGKPTWIEDEKTRVWTAMDATQCIRIVLQEDGSVDLEKMRTTETKVLSRAARQNLCTGKIEDVEQP